MRQFIDLIESAQNGLTREAVAAFEANTKAKHGLKVFFVTLNGKDLKLDSLIVPRESQKMGRGSAAMQDLCAFADAHGARLLLTPGIADDRHGTTSRTRLVGFYKRFGFVENKGRNRDFSISAGMIREPVKPRAARTVDQRAPRAPRAAGPA
jgi:GNAT superfamily N-acetyltransferase